jgi:hypothetical protein
MYLPYLRPSAVDLIMRGVIRRENSKPVRFSRSFYEAILLVNPPLPFSMAESFLQGRNLEWAQ